MLTKEKALHFIIANYANCCLFLLQECFTVEHLD
jgi:hypothetical protein